MATRRRWIVLVVAALMLVGACGGAAEGPAGDDEPASTVDTTPVDEASSRATSKG